MAPVEDGKSMASQSRSIGSVKGKRVGGSVTTPGKNLKQTKTITRAGTMMKMEKMEKPKEYLEAMAIRAEVLGKKDKEWEVVGASATIIHAFGSNASISDPVIAYAGPPSANSDHDFSDRIVCAVGAEVQAHNVDDSSKYFLSDRPTNVVGVKHIAVDPTMQFISVCEITSAPEDDEDNEEGNNAVGFAQLSIYALNTKNRECLSTLRYSNSNGFSASVFTKGSGNHSKQVAALCGTNNPDIVLWNWDSKKIVKIVSIGGSVSKLRCAPSSQVMLTTSGDSGLKAWYNAGESMNSVNLVNLMRESTPIIIDHVWMPSGNGLNKMCALSEVLEPGDSKRNNFRRQIVHIYEGTDALDAGKGDKNKTKKASTGGGGVPILLESKQTMTIKLRHGEDSRMSALASSQKGFIIVGNYGHVSFYERTDDKREPYIEVRHLSLGVDFRLVGATMLPSDRNVVVMTDTNRLISMPVEMSIESQAVGKFGGNSHNRDDSSISQTERLVGYGAADLTHGGVHAGAITVACAAKSRSIVATLSVVDNTLRIWNYETNKCEVLHHFGTDEPVSMDMHNNGLFLLVSFKDRVRGYNIAMASLIPHNEVVQKGCKEVKFSNGGDYFACASGINLVVFNTITFQEASSFQGHVMAIKRLAWAPGDQVLFSASVDGCVYGWPSARDGRIDVLASNPRASAVAYMEVDSDSLSFLPPLTDVGDDGAPVVRVEEERFLLLATNNGKINMPAWAYTNPTWDHDKDAQHCIWGEESTAITCMKLSGNRRHLYAGTKVGTVRIYAWPPVDDNKVGMYSEVQVHSGSVVSIFETPRGDKLVTSGEDGAVFIFSLIKAPFTKVPASAIKGGGMQQQSDQDAPATTSILDEDIDLEEPFQYNNNVLLLGTEEMDEHIEEVASLQKALKDLEASSTYKLSQVEMAARENERRMAESFDVTLSDERERYEQLRAEFDEKVKSLLTTIETKEADSLKVVADLENRYEHKLSDQLDRYDKLAEEMELLRQKCEGLLLADRNDFTKQLNDTINQARLREKKMRSENKRVTDDRASDEAAFKEILDQQEHEYEDELRQLIGAAEGELIIERENIAKLRTLVQTKNTKLDQLKKKLIELSMASKARASLLNNEKLEKRKLLETIEHYKKNLIEREEVVAEKEKIIIELRSKTRTLENFRFVLDHRLQQLSAERGPIASHIEGLERHISTMYEELVEEFETKKEAGIEKEKEGQRHNLVLDDLKRSRTQVRKSERYITSFKRELGNIVSAMVIGKELEESVRLLYRKYVKGEVIGETTVKASAEAQNTAKALLKKQDDDLVGMGSPGSGGGSPSKRGDSKSFALEVEETLIESAKEAERQKISKGKESIALKHRLESTRMEALVQTRKRLGENSDLLFEVNDLRKEVRKGERKLFERDEEIKELKHEMREFRRLLSKKGGAAPAPKAASVAAAASAMADAYSRAETPNIGDTFGAPPAAARAPGGPSAKPQTPGSAREADATPAAADAQNEPLFDENKKGAATVAFGNAVAGAVAEASRTLEGSSVEGVDQAVNQPRVEMGKPVSSAPAPVVQRSQSESVLRAAGRAGIDPRAANTTNHKWVVHNAMNLNKAESAQELGAGADARQEEITELQGQAWQPRNTNTQGTGQLQLQQPQAARGGLDVRKPSAATAKTQNRLEASKERQLAMLRDEKDELLNVLDESTRERENQRVEISQLRKQLMRFAGMGFTGGDKGIVGTGRSGQQQLQQMHQQSIPQQYTDDMNIQMSDEFHGSSVEWGAAQDGSIVLNGEPVNVARTLTTADRTGAPSASDLQDMRLGAVAGEPIYPDKNPARIASMKKPRVGQPAPVEKDKSKTISLPQINPAQSGLDTGSLVDDN